MGKDYTIYTKVNPGPRLVELTGRLIEQIDAIDTVRFVAWHENTENQPGVFIPKKKEVLIDLGNILNNYDLHRMGMLYVAGVWYTTLWTIFHEIVHGRQIDADPDLLDLIANTETSEDMMALASDYDHAAQIATKDMMREFVKENPLPPINEWGWLGEQITGTVNDLYAKGDTALLDEIDLLKQGAAASVHAVLASYEFAEPKVMFQAIDEGDQGIKLNDSYYLTAYDFFGLDHPLPTVAKSAPTVFMG